MIGWKRRVLLKDYLEQGMTKTAVAEKFGVSRRTVHHWIKTGQLDRDLSPETLFYGPRPPVPRKIDRYSSIILDRLDSYPELSAVRLFAEIKAAGYLGGYTQVKEYVRTVRPQPPEEPIVRFETPPGHQGQVDFADFRLPWGKRYALLVVLGYSRIFWLQFFRRKTMKHLFEGLENAFAYFGGVPAELLFDQMKAVIINDDRDDGGRVFENPEFLRFAHHWGFRIRACRPYRAQTKGKVERPIGYVRTGFFYGRAFIHDEDLNHQARSWIDTTANVRVHGTLKERPIDRFKEEQHLLGPLAPRPYQSFVLPPEPRKQVSAILPRIEVEHRPLSAYAQLAGGPS
jgi:transposase